MRLSSRKAGEEEQDSKVRSRKKEKGVGEENPEPELQTGDCSGDKRERKPISCT